jgi:hypothetical protein
MEKDEAGAHTQSNLFQSLTFVEVTCAEPFGKLN